MKLFAMNKEQEKLNKQFAKVILDDKASCEIMLKKMKYLHRLGADVNTMLYGKSALVLAIEKRRNKKIINYLKENGAKENVISYEERGKLAEGFWADSWFGRLVEYEEFERLVELGADVNAESKVGNPIIYEVSKQNNLPMLKLLIERGALVNLCNSENEISPLICAAKNNNMEMLKLLIENGGKVNKISKDGDTALGMAVNNKNIEMVKHLLDCGADAGIQSSIIERAILDDNFEIFNLLKDNGAKVKGLGLLGFARSLEMIEELCNNGVGVNERGYNGYTALMRFSESDWGYDFAKALIEKGADVNLQDDDGATALMHAVYLFTKEKMVDLLLEAGAKVRIKNNKGEDVFDLARRGFDSSVLKRLEKERRKEVLGRVFRIGRE